MVHDRPQHSWRAVLIPINYGLSGYLPGEQFDQCIEHFRHEGLFSEVRLSPGEPHDDDDVFYIHLSEAGARWLGLTDDSPLASGATPTTGI